jgi:hypothetical protein
MNSEKSGSRPESGTPRDVGEGVPAPPPDGISTAKYIAQMSAELAELAGKARLDMLAYFLDLARLEAEILYSRRK